ncbi:cbb3-type cytochrome c oxidase subunit I [Pseudacidobacterium ailaaui]|jgi:cbb3-type cytochrome c oxidase subunit II|uniref:cbb3-type cytochrome c oxidase subunit I n=1 Tax=Pseudacidobacterium ailaaui TaxID=1382359 RepID=UPI0009DD7ED9|nr:cbb3-type cytochrome c oxidase subunit I [Pseudacidobacterium ailaaui]
MSSSQSSQLIAVRLVRAHAIAAFFGLVVSALFGLAVSVKFHVPGFLGGHGWDTWGRLRYDHTQGILYAWLGNAFLAFLYYAAPLLTRRPITSVRLGWTIFWLWNLAAVCGGWSLVLAGQGQPLEWAEFPLAVAAVIELCLLLLVVQFGLPFWKCDASELYVSGWYFLGGLTFTALAYPVGNILPHLLPGAMGAAFSGLWIHDAVGVFVTPLATAIAYFVIPAVTRKPIYSHFYSMIGFWLLFLVYPLNGIHHYVYSSLPMGAQHASEVASIYQGIDVILVVTNLLLSLVIAKDGAVARDIPLRFVWTSVVLYLVVSIQGSIQAVMAFNSYIHFTDWVIGHSHLAMIGFASFAAMGGLAHVWQRVPGVRLNQRALAWSYWLLVIGLGLMVLDLTAAGLVQADLWRQHLPWMESVRTSRSYWVFRSFDGGLLLAGFVLFGASFFSGERSKEAAPGWTAPEYGSPGTQRADIWIRLANGATFGAGLVFFVLSFLALGVFPAIRLHRKIVETTPSGVRVGLSAEEKHGEVLYGENGCAYCHTEQVRFTPADRWRFGRPTEAWETQEEYPQMWGTRRIGPDLARESGKRTKDWQLVHLYDPRYVVPDSVMPGYPWLFQGGPDRPTKDALDLIAYVESLGRAAAQAAKDERAAPAAGNASVAWMPMQVHDDTRNFPAEELEEGRAVYLANCSGCHGADGRADSPGGRALRPVAFNLRGFLLKPETVWSALQNGVPGTAMPAWNDLPPAQFKAVGEYVQTLARVSDLPADELWASTEVLMEAGKRIFETHCVRCHGESGGGDGPDAAQFLPRPANFHEMLPSYDGGARAIHEGVPGSGMPAWPLLTPAEIQAVTYYIRSLYQGPSPSAPATVKGVTHAQMGMEMEP